MKNLGSWFAAFLGCLLILGSPSTASAEDRLAPADLAGRWVSHDNSYAGPARAALEVRLELGGVIVRFDYNLEQAVAEGYAPFFRGVAHYQVSPSDEHAGYWVDSAGNLLSIEAHSSRSVLSASWGDGHGRRGKTDYELTPGGTLVITDFSFEDGNWREFNRMEFDRQEPAMKEAAMHEHVMGIGGLFYKGEDPAALGAWYDRHFGITPAPTSYDAKPWVQQEGYTVFAPFNKSTDYFGDADRQWMVNLRVRNIAGLVDKLRAAGEHVPDPERHPNGWFTRVHDPEGNPIELWEPIDPSDE